jgi:hypothetical protein
MLDYAFERGFQETLKYKERFGTPNVPVHYKTSDGFKLGIWQNQIIQAYKKGTLSPDRIKRLEELGFKWKLI